MYQYLDADLKYLDTWLYTNKQPSSHKNIQNFTVQSALCIHYMHYQALWLENAPILVLTLDLDRSE